MFNAEANIEELEQICRELQEKLTQTYSQFGAMAGCQLIILN